MLNSYSSSFSASLAGEKEYGQRASDGIGDGSKPNGVSASGGRTLLCCRIHRRFRRRGRGCEGDIHGMMEDNRKEFMGQEEEVHRAVRGLVTGTSEAARGELSLVQECLKKAWEEA